MYLTSNFKYNSKLIKTHFETLYSMISSNKNPPELLQKTIDSFLHLINDEAHSINDELNKIHDLKKKKLFQLNQIKQKSNNSSTKDQIKEKFGHKSLNYRIKSGYQEVNDFVLDLIQFQRELSKNFNSFGEVDQTFIICFLYCVLYKDVLYNLFVNKPSSLKKIGFLKAKFETLRGSNLDILFFKFKRDAIEDKIEEKICRYNPKIVAILSAVDSQDIGGRCAANLQTFWHSSTPNTRSTCPTDSPIGNRRRCSTFAPKGLISKCSSF